MLTPLTPRPITESNQAISANFAWLKILAVIAMLFDHAAFGILSKLQVPEESLLNSAWRFPGRVSIPIFSFLVAYSLAHFTRNKPRYIFRLWLFALISEPFYWMYFHAMGNAIADLAVAATSIALAEELPTGRKRDFLAIAFGILTFCVAAYLRSLTLITVPSLVWCFFAFAKFNNAAWLLPALAFTVVSNHVAPPEISIEAMTIMLIFAARRTWMAMPAIKVNKWLMYGFYPIHLAVLLLITRYV